MKKIAYLLIISLLFTFVPTEQVSAASPSIAYPTMVFGHRCKDPWLEKGGFNVRLNHKNKNAKIYYRPCIKGRKYRCVKPGTTIYLHQDMRESNGMCEIYVQIRKKKNKVRRYNICDLVEKQVTAAIKKEVATIVNQEDNQVCRFMKLLLWFQEKYQYIGCEYDGHAKGPETCSTQYTHGLGTYFCPKTADPEGLSFLFVRYCDALGIKGYSVNTEECFELDGVYYGHGAKCSGVWGTCKYQRADYKFDCLCGEWCHVYLDKYPIIIDPYQITTTNGYRDIYNREKLDLKSYNKSKYKLNLAQKTKSKYFVQDGFFFDYDYYNEETFKKHAKLTEGNVLSSLFYEDDRLVDLVYSKDIKIENDLVVITYRLNPFIDVDYTYTKKIMKYDKKDGCWYSTYWAADGKLLGDDKAMLATYQKKN